MTDIPAWAGFVYLAVVLDVYSRKEVPGGVPGRLGRHDHLRRPQGL